MRTTWLVCAAGMYFSAACGEIHGQSPTDSGGGRADARPEPPAEIDAGDAQPLNMGATVRSDPPPPPITGGTLLVARDGHTAVVADPDRDRIYVADLTALRVVSTVTLAAGDEPGRVVETTDGHFAVALRRGGALVTLDATGALGPRVSVCPAPRGVAYDPATRLIHVACVGGELVSLRAGDLTVARTLHLEPDLRDVLVDGSNLYVSVFRAARLITVDANGGVIHNDAPFRGITVEAMQTLASAPHVAWRTILGPDHEPVMIHQTALITPVHDEPDAGGSTPEGNSPYGGGTGSMDAGVVPTGCNGMIDAMLTRFSRAGAASDGHYALLSAVLPVDLAVSRDERSYAVIAAGNAKSHNASLYVVATNATSLALRSCNAGLAPPELEGTEPVALAYDGENRLVVQTREPAALHFIDQRIAIPLSDESRADTGHEVFHMNSGAGLACASCHPEGGDDGHVWTFTREGVRRTQNLRGGLSGTEPFHWDGTMTDFRDLMGEVFHRRMGGPDLSAGQLAAVADWTDSIPRIPAGTPADPAAVARGRALFENPSIGCAGCHSGEHFTNNQTMLVGTGEPLQVPRLVGLAARAPYLHNGCAPTLRDRFGTCGGGDMHGHTSDLAPGQIDDLVAYLDTL